MIETESSQKQMTRTKRMRGKLTRDGLPGRKQSLGQLVAHILMAHSLSGTLTNYSANAREVEILGTIHGHLSAALPHTKIEQDPLIRGKDFQLRPDLVVVHKGESVVVEVKRFKRIPGNNVLEGFAKLERYLEALGTREGILYLVPSKPQDDVVTLTVLREIAGGLASIYIVTPSSVIENFDEVLTEPGWQPNSSIQ